MCPYHVEQLMHVEEPHVVQDHSHPVQNHTSPKCDVDTFEYTQKVSIFFSLPLCSLDKGVVVLNDRHVCAITISGRQSAIECAITISGPQISNHNHNVQLQSVVHESAITTIMCNYNQWSTNQQSQP
jgi:hypothetical protein